ncbi:MAG: RsmB/NOP family class I SAM-dependent RNA methyltransferase [Lentisphaerae bacterium]|nr:RsmB/NOP family class I SAM-dependent RNA methyltransferase [Lentisphaerota bacterium]
MNSLPPARLRSQATACATACAGVLWEALARGRPADRALAATLRENRQLGARDRRLLSETAFAVLRWWGWIAPLAPAPLRAASAAASAGAAAGEASAEAPAEAPPALRAAAWAPLLGAAWVLEGGELPPAAALWVQQAWPGTAIATADEATTPAQRRALLTPVLPAGTPLPEVAALLPEWALPEMDCPRPLDELIAWQQRRPPVWLRAQTTDGPGLLNELRAAGLEVEADPRLPSALHMPPPRVNLRTLEAFCEGRFEVQDLASQLIGWVCAPRPGQRWWDACAGAGGKTLHLADLMQRRGAVTASDIRLYKLEDLRRRARRAGFPNIRTREWKGKALPERRGNFDGVLVDAPCSCSGTWRRNPDGRWTTRSADLAEFAELQLRLLTHAATAVRPGGVLVYATCSMFRRENRQVVEAFLAAESGFALEPFEHPLGGGRTDGTLQTWPWDGDCDAMFVARFRSTACRAPRHAVLHGVP